MSGNRRRLAVGLLAPASALLLLSGCGRPELSTDSRLAEGELSPSIEQISLSCSAEDDRWEIEVWTQGWTAGGELLWGGVEPGIWEAHPLQSKAASAYGEWDQLSLSLSISADPRLASSGSSTALLCDDPTQAALRGQVHIWDPESEDSADCRAWGGAAPWGRLEEASCVKRGGVWRQWVPPSDSGLEEGP